MFGNVSTPVLPELLTQVRLIGELSDTTRQFSGIPLENIFVLKKHLAAGWAIQTAKQMKQRAFPSTGWTNYRNELSAIDGKMETAWGIYPETGHSHFAVFEAKAPIANESGTTAKATRIGSPYTKRIRPSIAEA